MPNDKWQENATIDHDEATRQIAEILHCTGADVQSWLVIAHIHPSNSEDHQSRVATNCPPHLVPWLVTEGLGTL